FYGSTRDGSPDHTQLTFGPSGGLNFWPALARWEHRTTLAGVNYALRASAAGVGFDGLSAPIDGKRLLRWSSSPEEFLAGGTELLDELEAALRDQIPSGAAT